MNRMDRERTPRKRPQGLGHVSSRGTASERARALTGEPPRRREPPAADGKDRFTSYLFMQSVTAGTILAAMLCIRFLGGGLYSDIKEGSIGVLLDQARYWAGKPAGDRLRKRPACVQEPVSARTIRIPKRILRRSPRPARRRLRHRAAKRAARPSARSVPACRGPILPAPPPARKARLPRGRNRTSRQSRRVRRRESGTAMCSVPSSTRATVPATCSSDPARRSNPLCRKRWSRRRTVGKSLRNTATARIPLRARKSFTTAWTSRLTRAPASTPLCPAR